MRNIVSKPHLTPNPDKPHAPSPPERAGDPAGARRPAPKPYTPPGDPAGPGSVPADDALTYDSCFDDLNLILSQSIQMPDPDPNLDSSSGSSTRVLRDEAPPQVPPDRGKMPRTSEVFRSVVSQAAGKPPSAQSSSKPQGSPPSKQEPGSAPESTIPEVALDRERHIQELASEEEDRLSEPRLSWGHVLLKSYASAITLAMIWMLWTGRWSKGPAPPPATSDRTSAGASTPTAEPSPVTPPPPIPPENLTSLRKTIRIGDLEVTPQSVTVAPVELKRSIEPDKRRREESCLILRLLLTNVSTDQTFTPLDENLVREHGLRTHDPYIGTSEGTTIGLFPLAIDSEWSIVGQEFRALEPGDSTETFVAAEPGSAQNLADDMTWRVRLRIGVYRTDMIGVRFTKDEVLHKTVPKR